MKTLISLEDYHNAILNPRSFIHEGLPKIGIKLKTVYLDPTLGGKPHDILGFLHINFLMRGEVCNYIDLINESEEFPFHKTKVVKFTFSTVEEALRRAAVIAILTYSNNGADSDFIRLHTLPLMARGVAFGSEI